MTDPAAGTPQVSVVLICFNDADRLPDAIESARAQSLADIEILIVDHGSTDGSVEVAQRAATADPRIRVLPLGDNEGKPGRPINAGIRAASAPWVTVFASDDVLRPRACEKLLETAIAHSADIVVGSLLRVNMITDETQRWMPGVSVRSRVVTSVAQLPELIRDTTGGGKLFNTDFVRRHDLSFPEDIYYQDQVFTITYYAFARTIAILEDYVLEWRHWPTGRQSVTQRRATLENLADRFSANERIDAFLNDCDRDDLLILKHRKFLAHDLGIHVRDLAETSAEYREALVSRTRSYLSGFPPEAFVGLPLNKRLMVNCLLAGRLAEAEQVTAIPYNRITATWQRQVVGDRTSVIPPWADTPAGDPVFDVTDYHLDQIPARFRAVRGEIAVTATRGGLSVEITATSVDRRDLAPPTTGWLVLFDVERGGRFWLPLRRGRRPDPTITRWRGRLNSRDLDAALSSAPGRVEVVAVFDAADAARWSLQLHPAADHPAVVQSPKSAWQAHVADDAVTVVRDDRPATTGRFRPVVIAAPPPVGDELSLTQARDLMRATEREPDRDVVLFESVAGRQVADGPLAVSRELHTRHPELRQVWSVTPGALPDVPPYAQAAIRFRPEWVGALQAAALWIDTGSIPLRAGPTRKRLTLPTFEAMLKLPSLAPLPPWRTVASTGPGLERAIEAAGARTPFQFERLGAPRTDPLFAASAGIRRQQLREAWGLTQRTVILFSPVRRFGEVAPEYRTPDLTVLADALGPSCYWLHREHDDDANGRRGVTVPDSLRWFASITSPRVSITDYLLLADVVVTDWSGVAADFGRLGRPVIHYVPDQFFAESVHPGAWVSLSDLAAGPIVTDDESLVAALHEISTPAAAAIPAPDSASDSAADSASDSAADSAGASASSPSHEFAQQLAPDDTPQSAAALLRHLGL